MPPNLFPVRLFYILFLASLWSYGQQTLQGVVVNAEDGTPLLGVTILNKSGNEWTITDENGAYSLVVTTGDFELEFRILGKAPRVFTRADYPFGPSAVIEMSDENLRLNEVTVTAVPKRAKVGSAITLGGYAVNQVQSYSLSDVLQQLPGQEITPPILNRTDTISLRTANPNPNNAFGIAFILDGLQLSNDENMQNYNLSQGLTRYDNVNLSIDPRTIPAANIEEIEVIAGVPDARYGNLTSGVIRIDRKAGVTPLRVNANIREGTTSLNVQKGFRISEKGGLLSLSLDYLNSNADPRNSLEQYDRITASAIWSVNSKDTRFRNTLSLTLHNNLDDTNVDLDNDDGGQDARFRKDRGFQINNRFNWQPESGWIDNLNVTVGYAFADQHSYNQSFVNNGGRVVPQNLETGLAEGIYTPAAYLQIREVFGRPQNLSGNIIIEKKWTHNRWTHNLDTGINVWYSDNRGRGRGYSPENAHSQVTLTSGTGSISSGEGIRATDFNALVNGQWRWGLFFQDNITYEFANKRKLFANLGVRYDYQNQVGSVSPRINMGYEITDAFSVRGALGFATKAPSLAQLFPGDKYFDVLIADFRTSSYSFNLVQTYREELGRLSLRPSTSWRYELGGNYSPKGVDIAFTAFYNQNSNGFTNNEVLRRVNFPDVEFTFSDPNTPPTYEVTGFSPFILDYSLPVNAVESIDKGVEFFININKIKAINTSFNINGTYTFSKSTNDLPRVIMNRDPLEETLLYGIYEREPARNDILRLQATVTHHISEIGLLISATVEQFTRTATYAAISSRFPVAYIDPELNTIPIPEAERASPRFESLFLNPSTQQDAVTPAYHNFHLRVTKELVSGLSMSLYSNNFLNHRPVVEVNGNRSIQNQVISFGATVNYTF